MCVRACVRACLRACVYLCVRASVCACLLACVRLSVRACVCLCVRACVRVCVRVCVRLCVRLCIYSFMCALLFVRCCECVLVLCDSPTRLPLDGRRNRLSARTRRCWNPCALCCWILTKVNLSHHIIFPSADPLLVRCGEAPAAARITHAPRQTRAAPSHLRRRSCPRPTCSVSPIAR
jgi:hypothetical protein